MNDVVDVLVLGGGPAALCIASELNQQGVTVGGVAPESVDAPWPNTYGIWADELKAVGLEPLLEHRWSDTVSFRRWWHHSPGSGRPMVLTTDCSIGPPCSAIGWSGPRVLSGIKTPPIGWS